MEFLLISRLSMPSDIVEKRKYNELLPTHTKQRHKKVAGREFWFESTRKGKIKQLEQLLFQTFIAYSAGWSIKHHNFHRPPGGEKNKCSDEGHKTPSFIGCPSTGTPEHRKKAMKKHHTSENYNFHRRFSLRSIKKVG